MGRPGGFSLVTTINTDTEMLMVTLYPLALLPTVSDYLIDSRVE